MKTLIVESTGKLGIREVSLPVISEYQALVKIASCGICNGTDAKLIHRAFKGYNLNQYPLMLGHEAVGYVVETGKKVLGLKEGDLVLLPFNEGIDGVFSAWGGFSEYGVVSDYESVMVYEPANNHLHELASSQTVLPKWIDPIEAVMIITLREVLSGIKKFGIKENSSVVVFGCGPVGLTFIQCLHLLGANPIIALDIVDDKLIQAKAFGANYVYNSKHISVDKTVKSICTTGVDFVVDAVGASDIINQAMTLIKDNGKICCYGISSNLNANIDWSGAPYNWNLIFHQFPSKREEYLAHNQVINWLEMGAINLRDYISDVFDFREVLIAFEKLDKRQIIKKGIVKFE